MFTQRSNLAGGRLSRAGRAPVVAGRPGEGVLLAGLGGVGGGACSIGAESPPLSHSTLLYDSWLQYT